MPLSHFSRFPFPSLQIIRMNSVAKQLLEGMVGARLIGFSYAWWTCVTSLVLLGRITGLPRQSGISKQKIASQCALLPDGIDMTSCKSSKKQQKHKNIVLNSEASWVRTQKKLIITHWFDWGLYSKGYSPADSGLSHNFFKNTKSCMAKLPILWIMDCGAKSRPKVQSYKGAQRRNRLASGESNSEYSTLTWVPVHYFYRSFLSGNESLLQACPTFALVTPLRDVWNLVCKEFL